MSVWYNMDVQAGKGDFIFGRLPILEQQLSLLPEHQETSNMGIYNYGELKMPVNTFVLTDEIVYTKVACGRWKGIRVVDRFWQKVNKTEKIGCWEWTSTKNQKGYGLLGVGGSAIMAHRVSWFIHFGEIPDGLFVLHTCDNSSCVNPDHLFLGTNRDNMKDMYDKGRRVAHRGEELSNAKLTNEQARKIKELYIPRTNKRRIELAKEFNVGEHIIQSVVYERTYKYA